MNKEDDIFKVNLTTNEVDVGVVNNDNNDNDDKNNSDKKNKSETNFSHYFNLSKGSMAIFIFLLIVSGNYLGNLFPCRIQDSFENNMYAKHFLGYFTLLFFVLFTMDEQIRNVNYILLGSFILYITFLLLSSTPYYIWFSIFIIAAIIYIFELKKREYNALKNKQNKNQMTNSIDNVNIIQYSLGIINAVLLVLGFLIYMGEKKIEYGKNFHYGMFLFGKPSCRGKTKKTNIFNSLKHSFD